MVKIVADTVEELQTVVFMMEQGRLNPTDDIRGKHVSTSYSLTSGNAILGYMCGNTYIITGEVLPDGTRKFIDNKE
jgi:hypothetical protein